MKLPSLRRPKPYVRPFEPTHVLDDGMRVRVLGEPFRVWHRPPGCARVACECPDRVVRPVNAERVRGAQ